jgi:hypothetical protein
MDHASGGGSDRVIDIQATTDIGDAYAIGKEIHSFALLYRGRFKLGSSAAEKRKWFQ